MSLRPYQAKAIEMIRDAMKAGHRKVLLRIPTGGGKTKIFAEVLKGVSLKERNGLVLVRGRRLVKQAAERIELEGVQCSVLMASDKRENPDALIAVASIDTIHSRKLRPKADIIVIDECHLAQSPAFDEVLSDYPDAFILAVTATPFHKRGFRHMADVMVDPVTPKELIHQGFLVPARYYVPERPDLSHVKKADGEYVLKDLAAAMNQARLFAPIVETWRRLGEGRPTLLFAVDVSHSKRLSESFKKAGIPSLHIDAKSSESEREAAISELQSGRCQVLCSVGLLLCGVDIPEASCLIVARPTLSYNVHLQLLGRGSRPSKGKKDFIVLDHAGNVETHGFYETHRPASLEGKPPQFLIVTITCERCFCTYEPTELPGCPGLMPDASRCGHVNAVKPVERDEIEAFEGTGLREVRTEEELEESRKKDFISRVIQTAKERGYAKGWCFHQIKNRFGEYAARGSWGMIHKGLA